MNVRHVAIAASIILSLIGPALGQQQPDPMITITLTQKQWLFLGSLLDNVIGPDDQARQKVIQGVAVFNDVQAQFNKIKQDSLAAQVSSFEQTIRDKVAAEQKAAAPPTPPVAGSSIPALPAPAAVVPRPVAPPDPGTVVVPPLASPQPE